MSNDFTAIHPNGPVIASDLNDINTINQASFNPVSFTM